VLESCGFEVVTSALTCAFAFPFSSLGSYLPFSAAAHRYLSCLLTYLPAYLPHTHQTFLFLKGIYFLNPAQFTHVFLIFPSLPGIKEKRLSGKHSPGGNNNNKRCPTRAHPSSTTANPPLPQFRVIIPPAAVENETRLLTTKFNISNHSSNSIRNLRIIINSTSGHTRSNSLSEVHTRVIIHESHRTGGI